MFFLELLSVVLLVYIGTHTYRIIKFKVTGDYNYLYNVRKKYRSEQAATDAILNEKYPYYKNLSPKGKNKFLARLSHVMNKVQFVGYDGLKITDEMEICVIFSMIQLTYGLKRFHFKRFKRINLYPKSFYSRFFNRELFGMASGFGFVSLSWADFQQGYLVPNDKYNLGLHEMAHALRLQLMDYGDSNTALQRLSDKMDKLAKDEKKLASRGMPPFLRDYAFANAEEFFSVCVEYFFEVPKTLKENKPEIFAMLCKMLNQNPLNTSIDYRVN